MWKKQHLCLHGKVLLFDFYTIPFSRFSTFYRFYTIPLCVSNAVFLFSLLKTDVFVSKYRNCVDFEAEFSTERKCGDWVFHTSPQRFLRKTELCRNAKNEFLKIFYNAKKSPIEFWFLKIRFFTSLPQKSTLQNTSKNTKSWIEV